MAANVRHVDMASNCTRMTKKFSVLSLFSGVGGLDYGFEAAGFETRVALEWDHQCCESLRASRSTPLIEADLIETPTKDILRAGDLRAGSVDMLIGGPPCQPFSKSGYSLQELARLQTFPENIVITGGRIEVQRQIGNAVPSLLAEVLARAIREQFFDSAPLTQTPVLAVSRRAPRPLPEPVKPVHPKYLELVGNHAAHPGTGRGFLYKQAALTLGTWCRATAK